MGEEQETLRPNERLERGSGCATGLLSDAVCDPSLFAPLIHPSPMPMFFVISSSAPRCGPQDETKAILVEQMALEAAAAAAAAAGPAGADDIDTDDEADPVQVRNLVSRVSKASVQMRRESLPAARQSSCLLYMWLAFAKLTGANYQHDYSSPEAYACFAHCNRPHRLMRLGRPASSGV